MRIVCPECGYSADIDAALIPADGKKAGCPKCRCRFLVLPEPAPPKAPAEPLLVVCPACSNEQPFAPSCHKCGTIFARYRPPELRKQEVRQEPLAMTGKLLLRKTLWPAVALLALLLLWIFIKDSIPTTVTTIHETLSATSGIKHSAVVRSDGTVWTWGENKYGQLGNGRRDGGHGQPEKVPGLEGVTAVAAGERHTLALKKDGTVWSWGDNEQWQLGDSSGSVGRTEPAQVAGLEGVTAIAAGDFFSVVLKGDGTLWYFGDGFVSGAANGGPVRDLAMPWQIEGISNVVSFACGRKSIIALKQDGSVWCWGYNMEGQCGGGEPGICREPVAVAGLGEVVAVAAGEQFSLALKKDGTVWGWGSLYIASGDNLQKSKPVQIPGLSGIKDIKAGYWMALALHNNGVVWHSGVGGKVLPPEKRSVADLLERSKAASITAIFAGGKDGFLEKRDGTLISWGVNDFGIPDVKGQKKSINMLALSFKPLPEGEQATPAAEAKPEAPEVPYQAIAAGFDHSLALGRDGTVWAWGENESGQLANSKIGSSNRPLQVYEEGGRLLSPVASIAAGSIYSLAVKTDGSVWIWGKNLSLNQYISSSRSGSNGQWGGTPHNAILPTRIEGVEDAVAVAGGYGGQSAFVALHKNGRLSCFGFNDKKLPLMQLRPLEGVTDIVAISAGARHFAALKSDGSVWTWGKNDVGQLGNGSNISSDIPRRVAGVGEVSVMAAGNDATLVVKKDGTVWGWGKDINAVSPGGLEVKSSLSPRQIPGLKDIASVSMPGQGFVTGSHMLAVDRSGKAWSWGFNFYGQLGQGTKGNNIVKRAARISDLGDVMALAAGGAHALALRSDGTIRSWGKNSSGQLGNLSGFDSAFPVSVVTSRVSAEKIQ